MKKYSCIIASLAISLSAMAQETIYPALPQKGLLIIKNATVHVGNGQVLANTTIQVNNGKIEKMGANLPVPADDVKVVDASGKHVYPGLILSNSNIGLKEIGSQVRGSNDFNEIGELNPNIQSIVAYNTDSKIINTLRSNGILLANIIPSGQLLAGSSSVVQFDAWSYEEATYKKNGAMHFYMPSLFNRPRDGAGRAGREPEADPLKAAMDRIEKVKAFFRDANAYQAQNNKVNSNLKFESVKGLFNQSQSLFVHCNLVKEILVAVDFAKEFDFKVTIVGGSESYQVADLIKQNNMSVILQQLHSLPTSEDDDVDQPFKTPAALQKAGVLFAITDEDGQTTGRNLMFNAGTAASYGLGKEEALAAITLNAAKILGIADRTGSIEVGKDANLIISEGDILDMKSSIVTKAFIQGRDISLDDKHKQLNERYKKKYNTK
ncbi:MAG: amidohydrolase family protein [Gloeobacteraceae cyanobacterium ES-bin-316]|nr:amidohydrolase family protein [Ferruginibacter sp.]